MPTHHTLPDESGSPPLAPIPDEFEDIVIPTSAKNIVTKAQIKEMYDTDQVLQRIDGEVSVWQAERASLAPNIRELQTTIDRLKRNKTLLTCKINSGLRQSRTRRRLLIQKVFDKQLARVRTELGLSKPQTFKLNAI